MAWVEEGQSKHVSLREQLRMSSDLRSLETGIPRPVLQPLPWIGRRLCFLRVSCLWSYGSCHYQGRGLSCQLLRVVYSPYLPAKLQTQLSARRPSRPLPGSPTLSLTHPPWLIVPTSASPPLEFSFFPSTWDSEKRFYLLWNRKLAFERSEKEPICMLLVPQVISTASRP